MAKGDRIARLPTYERKDEWCSICADDNIVAVLDGQREGTIVFDSIVLCSYCLSQLKEEIDALEAPANESE